MSGGAFVLTLSAEQLEQLASMLAPLVAEQLAASVRSAPASEFLTVEEAAAFLGTRAQRIYDLRSCGRLRRYGDGRKALVKRAELEAYVDPGR